MSFLFLVNPGRIGKNTMLISLFFSQPTITVETEVYLYDGISFFGEVGGYMGLYLGFSMLSIYEAAEDFVLAKLRRRKLGNVKIFKV